MAYLVRVHPVICMWGYLLQTLIVAVVIVATTTITTAAAAANVSASQHHHHEELPPPCDRYEINLYYFIAVLHVAMTNS